VTDSAYQSGAIGEMDARLIEKISVVTADRRAAPRAGVMPWMEREHAYRRLGNYPENNL